MSKYKYILINQVVITCKVINNSGEINSLNEGYIFFWNGYSKLISDLICGTLSKTNAIK